MAVLRLTARLDHFHEPEAVLSLPWAARRSSGGTARLADGRAVELALTDGLPLRGGDLLVTVEGLIVIVQAAPEPVSTAFQRDARLLARAAWHLGRRGVAVQLGDTWLRYGHEPVLDALCESLNLRVFQELAPFEPETDDPGEAAPVLVNVFRGRHEHGHGHHDHHHHHHHHD